MARVARALTLLEFESKKRSALRPERRYLFSYELRRAEAWPRQIGSENEFVEGSSGHRHGGKLWHR
jgi:hypothetical protein